MDLNLLVTPGFVFAICKFERVIRTFELVTLRFVLATREFKLVTCGYVLVTRECDLTTHELELTTSKFEIADLIIWFVDWNLYFWISVGAFNLSYRKLELATYVLLCHPLFTPKISDFLISTSNLDKTL